MNGLRTAFGFLTRIPIRVNDPVLSKAAPWFPVVGLLIGLGQGAVLVALRSVLPAGPAAVLAVAVAALLTGAFHHDGLADMADAFGGGWTVEQRLSMMKDSRLGTYGTSALILAFATEISVLASLEAEDGFRAVVAAHCASRAIAVVAMKLAPLAPNPSALDTDDDTVADDPASNSKSGRGLGAAYAADLSVPGTVFAAVVGVAVAGLAFAGTLLAVPAIALALISALAVVGLSIRKIGGITGDVLGAIQQMASLAILVIAAGAVV